MPNDAMIQCENLTKRFGHVAAVDHVSLSVVKLPARFLPSAPFRIVSLSSALLLLLLLFALFVFFIVRRKRKQRLPNV